MSSDKWRGKLWWWLDQVRAFKGLGTRMVWVSHIFSSPPASASNMAGPVDLNTSVVLKSKQMVGGNVKTSIRGVEQSL